MIMIVTVNAGKQCQSVLKSVENSRDDNIRAIITITGQLLKPRKTPWPDNLMIWLAEVVALPSDND